MTTFNKLYMHYKNAFDIEMMLRSTNTTYERLNKENMENDKWF